MNYIPFNYETINVAAGFYNPSMVKSYNNMTYAFWERALFQRAMSVVLLDGLPDTWEGNVRDFLYYCLFKFGYVAVSENAEYGTFFQPCTLSGQNFYYQPIKALISNPLYSDELTIGTDCEILKLNPDYTGIWDIISYYAEKLSLLDNAINISLINNKYGLLIGAKTKAAAEALKKMLDKVNKGEPAVITDSRLLNDPESKDNPFTVWEKSNPKDSYLTTEQLSDFSTIMKMFDTEIGIPTVDSKKERMVTSEAESKIIDATSRSIVWKNTLESSLKAINKHYDLNITVKLRSEIEEGGETNGIQQNYTDRDE